jgi:hypothetical protein
MHCTALALRKMQCLAQSSVHAHPLRSHAGTHTYQPRTTCPWSLRVSARGCATSATCRPVVWHANVCAAFEREATDIPLTAGRLGTSRGPGRRPPGPKAKGM